jgi:hypothetical protein
VIDLRFVPLNLKAFPGGARERGKRRASTVFSSAYNRTLDRLEHELHLLGAIDIVVEAGYSREDLRNDGWPRSSAKPSHPAVVLAFRSKKSGEEYSFPCDTFTTFEHNLHAIAFTLEALRAVNRYGVTRGHEQYKGFAQIEAPPDTKRWTVDAAAAWLAARHGGNVDPSQILQDPGYYREAYRLYARLTHPDANEAATEEWNRLQDAKRLLDAHHGGTAGGVQ